MPPPFFELFDNMPGAAPLHFAALTGNLGAVDLLLTRRADPDLKNARGRTALALAAMAGHNDVVLRLRAAGAKNEHDSSRQIPDTPSDAQQLLGFMQQRRVTQVEVT